MKLFLGRTAAFVLALPLVALQLADDAYTAVRTRRDRARWNASTRDVDIDWGDVLDLCDDIYTYLAAQPADDGEWPR